jgi:hypothetical protein
VTAVEARAYAERVYVEEIESAFTISLLNSEAALIKDKLAHAYMDGGIEILTKIRIPVCQPITATVNQPESEEWSKPTESTEQRIERGNRELGEFA